MSHHTAHARYACGVQLNLGWKDYLFPGLSHLMTQQEQLSKPAALLPASATATAVATTTTPVKRHSIHFQKSFISTVSSALSVATKSPHQQAQGVGGGGGPGGGGGGGGGGVGTPHSSTMDRLPIFIPVPSTLMEAHLTPVPISALHTLWTWSEVHRELPLQATVEKLQECIPVGWKKVVVSACVYTCDCTQSQQEYM